MVEIFQSTYLDGAMSMNGAPFGAHHNDRMRLLDRIHSGITMMSRSMFQHIREVFADIVIPTDKIVIMDGTGEIAQSYLSGEDIAILVCPHIYDKAMRYADIVVRTTYNLPTPQGQFMFKDNSINTLWTVTHCYYRDTKSDGEAVSNVYKLETFKRKG